MMKYKDFVDLATISRSHHSSLGFFFGQKFLIHKLHRDSSVGEMCDRQSGQEFQPTDALSQNSLHSAFVLSLKGFMSTGSSTS